MEIRRLQKIKGGSFTLSLPRRWVEKGRLKSGEQIAVSEEEDGSLRLYPITEAFEKPLEVTLKLEDYPDLRALEYCIGTYYIQGSNKISIVSKDIIPAEHKKRLKLLRMELPGIEVAEEEANKLGFQVLIDPAIFSLESLIEKTSSFSLHLQEDAVRSILERNFQLAAEVMERSKEALRHYRITIRQIALASLSRSIAKKVGVRNCQECITFALIARDLNRLVYHSSSIARHFLTLEHKKGIDREILDMLKDMSKVAHEMQGKAVQAFLKKDVKLAIITMGKMDTIRGKEKVLLVKVREKIEDVDTGIILGMIARDLRRIAGYAVAMADDAMNRVLTPVSHLPIV
ncbi:MAG: PhoU domain protein [Candidatus Bathyarchaeota archaeon BA1]|nr:MAG: PhoU domain protein [Candidatus Bathyarchaeota archaeon BA1]